MRLHRTAFPDEVCHQGKPLAAYWFEHDGEVFGVTSALWDGAVLWEVFHGATVAVVRDDYDRLGDVRREAADDCSLFLLDLRAEVSS